jgi:hypothetical protein
MKKTIIFLGILAILIIGYFLISPAFSTIETNEDSPLQVNDVINNEIESQAELLSTADFIPSAHEVEGKALLIEQNGKKILRFENFETINGPNLHIYLASDLNDDDFIDLGEIKATSGNVNYEIPNNIDTDKYDKVLVWCVPFKILFSYADL